MPVQGDANRAQDTVADVKTPRPLRTDAERNRVRIVTAAREVFAQRGLDASMSEIAAHAGVGVGSVYRKWPTKEALIAVLFQDGMSSILALGQCALQHDDPWQGLASYLEGLLEIQAADRGLKEIMIGRPDGQGGVDPGHEEFARIAAGLVARAQASGQLRTDIDATDIALLQLMIGDIVDITYDIDPRVWRRYLAITLDGLKAQAATPLPVPPLGLEQVATAMGNWRPHR